MAAIVFIGDELTATGLRLAGIDVVMPRAEEAAAAFAKARREAAVVLVSSALAPHLPDDVLQAALLAGEPLVAIVPEVTGRSLAPDIAARLKATLGIEV